MNNLRLITPVLVAAVVLETGCGKSSSDQGAPPTSSAPKTQAPAVAQTVARIHWIGKNQLALQTDAAYQMSIWNLPESVKLENQTLDKLSRAPWTLLDRKPDTNAGALLRPLLDDVVHQGCYLEVRQATNQPGQLVFAIRLDDRHAALWETNLAAVLESLTGIRPAATAGNPRAWSLKKDHAPNFIELTRAGEWTILGAAEDHNALLGEIVSRIRRDHAPFGSEVTNEWFQAALDLPRLPGALWAGWNLRGDWPNISIAVFGEGANVQTRGELDFAKLPPLDLDPWNIPISLIDEPLVSFTAIRGFKAWLSSLKAWNDLQIGPPPNQVCFWGLVGRGMNTYGVAPLLDASNEVYKLTDLVLQKGTPWFATNDLAKFRRSETFNGLEWQGSPWLVPSLQSLAISNGNFVFGGLCPNLPLSPPLSGYFDKALGETNLVYYDWELTDPRTAQWLYIGQFARFVSLKAQMPESCASLDCLKVIGPKLGVSVTRIIRTGTGRLSLDRTSSIGFTSLELHLLADWLESPQFPIGLHTFLAP